MDDDDPMVHHCQLKHPVQSLIWVKLLPRYPPWLGPHSCCLPSRNESHVAMAPSYPIRSMTFPWKNLQLYRRVPSHAWSVPLPLSQVLPGSGNISFCTQLNQDGIGTGDRWWSSASGENQVQPEMRQWCCTWVYDGKWLNDQQECTNKSCLTSS